jgi:hypothetical protein
MNYLSDDEHDETNDTIYDEDDIINQNEELDEETRNIIYNKVRDFNEDEFNISKTKEPKNNNKPRKTTITLDFLLAKNKSKKWESTRASNKKTNINSNKEEKRHFNPKLPPYRTIMKDRNKSESTKIEINDDTFPSL